MNCTPNPDRAVNHSRVKIACIGNSITFGAGMEDRQNNAYPVQLQHMLGEGYEVKNFGVNGRTLLRKGDLPYWETQEYADALAFRADIVFIKLGTNDSKQQNRIHLDEFESDYKTLIATLLKANKEARIILLLPVPSLLEDTTSIWGPVIKQQITPTIQKVAYDTRVEVLDLYPLLIDKPGLLPDKIHPSSLGATLIAKRTYEAVKHESYDFDLIQTLGIQNTQKSNFHGFDQYDFEHDGLSLKVVQPKRPLFDKPWIWRARFFGHEPQTDIALLERGYHVVYCEVGSYFGNPEAVSRWNKCYDLMTRAGLHPKPALEGMSRGGLVMYNWAAENIEKVACIYADAPVLDARSWPGGFGKSKGSPNEWQQVKQRYGLSPDSLSPGFNEWPIHKADLFAKPGIPILHVCGEADQVVPVDENTRPFENAIKEKGGKITTIYKSGVGHHPHSLENPGVIVDFILRATGHKTNFAAIAAPGSEYRAAAGWVAHKGWWAQAAQIDSLCQVQGNIDLLLIGNSITQGWGGPRNWVTYKPGQQAADHYFKGLNWIGAGISGDKTQNIAWRIKTGHYGACQPNVVALAIGVNNFPEDVPAEIVVGLQKILQLVEEEFRGAQVLFFGPLPAGLEATSPHREKYREVHRLLAQSGYSKNVHYYDLEQLFSNTQGTLNKEYYSSDGIHLTAKGYEVWAKFTREQIDALQ